MIKANELRVGNMFWEDYGGYKVVTAINSNNVGDAPNTVSARSIKGTVSGQYSCSQIEPIPLTPEILEKCGFRQQGKRNLYSDGKLAFMEDADGFTFFIKDVSNVLYKSVANSKIYYLHQLQNLYFALTGDELKIEL